MKAPVACPNCGSSFSVSKDNEGKRAKCPKCEQPFIIKFSERTTTNSDALESPVRPPATLPTVASSSVEFNKPKPLNPALKLSVSTLPKWVTIAAPAAATLIVGYFIGREHIKYQLRSAVRDVATAFSEGLSKNLSGSSSAPAVNTTSAAEAAPEPVPERSIGEPFNGNGFSLTLVSARIGIAQIKEFNGDIATGQDPVLILSFKIDNTDERKILRYREGNQFLAPHFLLKDDVDNVIRGVSYGYTSMPIGALTGKKILHRAARQLMLSFSQNHFQRQSF